MLTGKQKRYLRGEGTLLNPSVYIGKEGLTEEVKLELMRTIESVELMKVRIGKNSDVEIKETGEEIAEYLGAELVQCLGRIGLFFKKKSKGSNYRLP